MNVLVSLRAGRNAARQLKAMVVADALATMEVKRLLDLIDTGLQALPAREATVAGQASHRLLILYFRDGSWTRGWAVAHLTTVLQAFAASLGSEQLPDVRTAAQVFGLRLATVDGRPL